MEENINNPKSLLSGIGDIVKSIKSENADTPPVQPVSLSKQKDRKSVREETLCTRVDAVNMGKLRAISETESVTIKDIVNFSIETFIEKYESLNGKVVHAKRKKKGDLSKILGSKRA